ncbi:uncharacterized protein N7469_006185 [Penicillium citrinum]|uniref:SAP domain-containing protein n=2 Tax=Penicillium TaxID=5073 RepID=A0A9W9NZU1_PENCI|nr:uncharacterized protein N7469_006185 [Penicillium citrinum]KAJ5231597.1 hypothetical protein N7469_006185 [Penicillium citrinum]KAJ5579130.1 hypothetical protein N7450_007997 [Penicillium hetheringtonii]
MAAPRSTSLRALRQLSNKPSPVTRRGLHITGVQSAQPANPADKASLYAARSLPDLKSECQRRSIRAAGSKSELVERLSNHDALQTRAFSIAMRRINPNAFAETRQFNTSRASKAVGDSSTVDFIYMPTMSDMDAAPIRRSSPQIPVLPDMHSIQESSPNPSAPPMKPQIYTVAGSGADVAASAMSEVVDNHAVDIDPFSLTEAVSRSRVGEEIQRRQNGSASRESGVVKELWSGFLDDVLGPKQAAARK